MSNAETQQLSGSRQIAILGHLRQNAAAKLIGISARRLRDHAAPRNSDGTYNGPELVRWHLSRAEELVREKLALDRELAGDDPEIFAGGGNSPWLEQCRREKARELKRKNEAAEGGLVETAAVAIQLAEISQVFRNRAEAIERVHGPKVGQDIRDMVDEAEAAWKRSLPEHAPKEPQAAEKQLELKPEPGPKPPVKKKPKKKKQAKPKKKRGKRRRARALEKPSKVPPAPASRTEKAKKKKPRAGAADQSESLQQSRPAGYRRKKRGSGYRIGR